MFWISLKSGVLPPLKISFFRNRISYFSVKNFKKSVLRFLKVSKCSGFTCISDDPEIADRIVVLVAAKRVLEEEVLGSTSRIRFPIFALFLLFSSHFLELSIQEASMHRIPTRKFLRTSSPPPSDTRSAAIPPTLSIIPPTVRWKSSKPFP